MLQSSFSLMVFGWAQIVMDIQPLVVLITGEGHLHGFTHTYLGATLLGAVSTLTGKYLSEFGLVLIGISRKENPIKISWVVATSSATIGTYSHLILDALMHSDVQQYFPLSLKNELFGMIKVSELHQLCFYMAVIGSVLFFIVQFAIKYITRYQGGRSR
jgi:hypothetical protein